MNRKLISWAALAALSTAPLSAQTLTDLSNSVFDQAAINGARFLTSRDTITVSGTGVYNTFLAFADDGDPAESVEGFNSGSGTLFPEVNAAKTFALTGLQLTTVQDFYDPADILYGFGADINEPASLGREYISVDRLQVWVKTAPDISPANTEATLTGSGAIKIWDLDDANLDGVVDVDRSILFNYLLASSGSGRSDLLFVLPEQKFIDQIPTWTTDKGNYFVYLFARMGDMGTTVPGQGGRDYSENSGGFEEWQTVGGLVLLPEASTYAAIGVVGLAAAGVWRRSRRSKA